jgi:hypothetical protein
LPGRASDQRFQSFAILKSCYSWFVVHKDHLMVGLA